MHAQPPLGRSTRARSRARVGPYMGALWLFTDGQTSRREEGDRRGLCECNQPQRRWDQGVGVKMVRSRASRALAATPPRRRAPRAAARDGGEAEHPLLAGPEEAHRPQQYPVEHGRLVEVERAVNRGQEEVSPERHLQRHQHAPRFKSSPAAISSANPAAKAACRRNSLPGGSRAAGRWSARYHSRIRRVAVW